MKILLSSSSDALFEICVFPMRCSCLRMYLNFSSGDPKVTLRTIAGGGIDIHIDSMWDTQLIVEEIINTVGEIKKISCGIIG